MIATPVATILYKFQNLHLPFECFCRDFKDYYFKKLNIKKVKFRRNLNIVKLEFPGEKE